MAVRQRRAIPSEESYLVTRQTISKVEKVIFSTVQATFVFGVFWKSAGMLVGLDTAQCLLVVW